MWFIMWIQQWQREREEREGIHVENVAWLSETQLRLLATRDQCKIQQDQKIALLTQGKGIDSEEYMIVLRELTRRQQDREFARLLTPDFLQMSKQQGHVVVLPSIESSVAAMMSQQEKDRTELPGFLAPRKQTGQLNGLGNGLVQVYTKDQYRAMNVLQVPEARKYQIVPLEETKYPVRLEQEGLVAEYIEPMVPMLDMFIVPDETLVDDRELSLEETIASQETEQGCNEVQRSIESQQAEERVYFLVGYSSLIFFCRRTRKKDQVFFVNPTGGRLKSRYKFCIVIVSQKPFPKKREWWFSPYSDMIKMSWDRTCCRKIHKNSFEVKVYNFPKVYAIAEKPIRERLIKLGLEECSAVTIECGAQIFACWHEHCKSQSKTPVPMYLNWEHDGAPEAVQFYVRRSGREILGRVTGEVDLSQSMQTVVSKCSRGSTMAILSSVSESYVGVIAFGRDKYLSNSECNSQRGEVIYWDSPFQGFEYKFRVRRHVQERFDYLDPINTVEHVTLGVGLSEVAVVKEQAYSFFRVSASRTVNRDCKDQYYAQMLVLASGAMCSELRQHPNQKYVLSFWDVGDMKVVALQVFDTERVWRGRSSTTYRDALQCMINELRIGRTCFISKQVWNATEKRVAHPNFWGE